MNGRPIRSILVSQAELRVFLSKNYKGFHTKDYELLIGLNLALIGSEESGIEHFIGLPTKQYAEREIAFDRSEENIARVIRSYLEEATDIDLILVPALQETVVIRGGVGNVVGRGYQLKRFAYNREAGDISAELISYLQTNIPRLYSPSPKTDLVLVIGGGSGGGNFDMDKISQSLVIDDYPFEHILFVTGDDRILKVGEFWPTPKSKEYSFPI